MKLFCSFDFFVTISRLAFIPNFFVSIFVILWRKFPGWVALCDIVPLIKIISWSFLFLCKFGSWILVHHVADIDTSAKLRKMIKRFKNFLYEIKLCSANAHRRRIFAVICYLKMNIYLLRICSLFPSLFDILVL